MFTLLTRRNRVTTTTCVLMIIIWSAFAVRGQISQSGLAVKRVVGMEYPWFARMAVLQGTVELMATISRAGEVERIRVVSGAEPLATPAKETLSKWRFTACDSQTSECEARFVFLFVLDGSCSVSSHCPTDFAVDLPDKITVKSRVFDSPVVQMHMRENGTDAIFAGQQAR